MTLFTSPEKRIIAELANGRPCSGSTLGAAAGVSRAAIWKHIASIKKKGLGVVAIPGVGYSLAPGVQLLDVGKLSQLIDQSGTAPPSSLLLSDTTASTNTDVAEMFQRGLGHRAVCLAEQQTSGKGRRGRAWYSPYARNFYCSFGWTFVGSINSLEGLSLAMGVVVARCIERVTGVHVGLKWPNDLQVKGEKLGGILIELSGDAAGPFDVILGIGVNLQLDDTETSTLGQPATSLAQHAQYDRNELTARLVCAVLEGLDLFSRNGFVPFSDDWNDLDVLRGREVRVIGTDTECGVAVGVRDDGALMVSFGGEVRPVFSGEVSVRA